MPSSGKSSRLRRSTIVRWERSVHTSLNFANALETHPHNVSTGRRFTAYEEIDEKFWVLFFERLPREVRDLVYEYVIGYAKSIYTIQHDRRIFRYDPRKSVRPFSLLPHPLDTRASGDGNGQDDVGPLIKRFLVELTRLFFATNRFYIRYRYTPFLLHFLTTPFRHTSCIPIQHMRHLSIILSPPECTEDSFDSDEDGEFEWEDLFLFPRPKNAKCDMFRERLVEHFKALGEVLGEEGCALRRVDVVVNELMTGEEGAGFRKWMEGWRSLGEETVKIFWLMD